jgi:hypothetical protein
MRRSGQLCLAHSRPKYQRCRHDKRFFNGIRQKRPFLSLPIDEATAISSFAGAPTVPLDTMPRLNDYPAKPCGARPWM